MVESFVRQMGVSGAALALVSFAVPAEAQFGGLLGRIGSPPAEQTANGCPKGKKRSTGSSILGSIAGSVAGSAASRVGGVFNWVPIAGLTDQLTAAIACKLDPEEQKQAAQATLDATRGAGDTAEVAVGTSSSWTSATRADVSGTSTVVARNDADTGGLQCIMVSDVIIVSGEETRADKRMCRKPPAARYALSA
jgi:hypothetical protein